MPTLHPKSHIKVPQLPTEDVLWIPDEQPEQRKTLLDRMFTSMSRRAQLAKLVSLMFIAGCHVVFMNCFIHNFRAYEELANQVEESGAATTTNSNDLNAVRFLLRALVDYKKNLWVTVGAMCASLATSAFLIFLLEYGKFHKLVKIVVRLVDVLAFMVLPCLLTARYFIASNLEHFMEEALRSANRLTDINEFINELKCSIVPRENLPSCTRVMLRSIFPVKVLEYLIILCLLTGAYIALAYLIEYCIRHFFPPTRRDRSATENIHKQPLVLPSV